MRVSWQDDNMESNRVEAPCAVLFVFVTWRSTGARSICAMLRARVLWEFSFEVVAKRAWNKHNEAKRAKTKLLEKNFFFSFDFVCELTLATMYFLPLGNWNHKGKVSFVLNFDFLLRHHILCFPSMDSDFDHAAHHYHMDWDWLTMDVFTHKMEG